MNRYEEIFLRVALAKVVEGWTAEAAVSHPSVKRAADVLESYFQAREAERLTAVDADFPAFLKPQAE